MHCACHVFILFQILLISEFQRKALSDDGVIIAKDKQILALRARRSVSGSQPLIQGSVAGTPSALNIAQQNLISASSYKGQSSGQSLTPFAQATGQSITAVSAQPAVQPSTLNVKTQTEGQYTNSIQQTTGQYKGTGLPNGEELEEDPDMDQNSNDELDEYDDSETDPEVLTDCCRRRPRRRRRKCRHCFRQHFRYPRRRRLRGGGSRLREPMDDDYYFDRDRERVDDWLDFKGSPDYYGDNAEGGVGENRGGTDNEGNGGGNGDNERNRGGNGDNEGNGGGNGDNERNRGGNGDNEGNRGGNRGTGGTGGTTGGYGGTGGTGGGGGGGGGGRPEGTDCCCVKWGGIKPHVEWVNVPVCYRPCCIAKPHCEHFCDIDCHHCACEPCCGGCCCHHCPCCHCCHHCCHCCHCRREIVANKPTCGRRKKASKRKRTKMPKKKKYHKRHCFCVTPLIMRLPYFPRLW